MIEYGVVYEHASADVYEDLVGPTYESVPEATSALITGSAAGYRGVVVQRVDEGPWEVLTTKESPVEWVRAQRAGTGA